MKLGLNILESTTDISKMILQQMASHLDSAISRSIPSISNELKLLVSQALRNQPEYSSLMAGTLKAEFGIPNSSVIESVIDALVETLTVVTNKVTIKGASLGGGFLMTMMKSDDMNGVIYTDIASTDADGKFLPWLQWLLLEGNNGIVQGYDIRYGSYSNSRTGMAIMVSSSSDWRVPSQFAGTSDNNWTTRAISSVEKDIYNIIQTNIESRI